MAVIRNLTGLGTPPATASAIAGLIDNAVTAAGSSSQANAKLLGVLAGFHVTTGAGNSGIIFAPGVGSLAGHSPGDNGFITNTTGQTIIVYPPTGGKINNGTANAGVNLTTNQNAIWWTFDALNFFVLIV